MRLIGACALALLLATPSLARDKQVQDDPNTLTHGMVQMTLKVGETSQGQILETFGAPNITSIDGSGQEMWVYDRHATVTSNNSSGFSIGMLAAGGAMSAEALVWASGKRSRNPLSRREQ